MGTWASIKKKIGGGWIVWLFILIPVGCGFALQANTKMARVVLQTDSGLYFLSNTDGDGTRYFLSQGSQPVQKWVNFTIKGGEYYIATSDIDDFAALFAVDLEFFPYDGGDHQGAFGPSDEEFMTVEQASRPSDRLGVSNIRYDVHLVSQIHDRAYDISWWSNKEPVENCELKRLWVDVSYKPNARTLALKKELLVNLTDLAEGLGVQATFDYNRKDKVLYLTMQ